MAVLGIDFGSSYTTASWINPRHGKPEVVKFNGDGSVKLPSVIMGMNSNLVLGFEAMSYLEEINNLAREERLEFMSNFIPSIKRTLDAGGVEFLGNRKYTHLELLTVLFSNIKKLANSHCGNNVVFDTVSVSYPVEFEHSKIELLEKAMTAAGFSDVHLKMEPVSAVQGYGIDHQINEGEGMLVFDFGGGTVDVAYVQKHNSQLKLLCQPRGNNMCGGQDFDMILYNDLRKKLLSEYSYDISSDGMVDYGMLNSCRRLKEHFSGPNDYYETSILFVSDKKIHTFKYGLNRETFNSLIYQKVSEAVSVAQMVISEVQTKKYQINKVLLIGGSSQLTLVRELLSSKLGGVVIDTCGEKDVAVALGNIAEYYETSKEDHEDIKLHETADPRPAEPEEEKLELDYTHSIECPHCKSKKCYKIKGRKGYHCNDCNWEGVYRIVKF